MTYSSDLRERVLDFVASGGSKTQAAKRFSLHRSTVHEWLKQPEDHKAGKPGPKGAPSLTVRTCAGSCKLSPICLFEKWLRSWA